MTVLEYRQKHPDCEYCCHNTPPFDNCLATNKRKSKRRAKKCPCYAPERWSHEKEKDIVFVVDCVKMVYDANGILKAIHRPDGSGRIYGKNAVSMVRCKNCKNYDIFSYAEGFGWCKKFNNGVINEHYCNYGERRYEND